MPAPENSDIAFIPHRPSPSLLDPNNFSSLTAAADNTGSLSPTTKYPEKEINVIIANYHDDTAAIRRHMIEYGILERNGASVYWLPKD